MDVQGMEEIEEPSKCIKFLYLFWKFCTCIFSHVTLVSLVVAYCLLGATVFVHLEAENETRVKQSIQVIRDNVTGRLWNFTLHADVLRQENWTKNVTLELIQFETTLLNKMKMDGWNGIEEVTNKQWTFSGALFYSIIVITTIGYGHIAPKTEWGKVVTIFYAILGIPLMLLCLSNIGDIMATSFRFLYWKVCCYVCTKPPRRRRPRSVRNNVTRQSGRYSNRATSFRRSMRASQRSADSALGLSDGMTRSSYSDTECRYHLEGMDLASNFPSTRPSTMSRYSDIPLSSPRVKGGRSTTETASLDRRAMVNPSEASRIPILFNKYALNPEDEAPKTDSSNVAAKRPGSTNDAEVVASSSRVRGTGSLPRHHHLDAEMPNIRRQLSQPPPEIREPHSSIYVDMDSLKRSLKMRRTQSYYGRSHQREAPSPRIMSPMGYAVHRQVYADDFEIDYDYYPGDYEAQRIKPVPIWLCVFLVVSYILGGASLFSSWENWSFLNSAYFCFITLTTIGFGDYVPSRRLSEDRSIAFCSLYLLFGISLLAMSFNLVQEEVITKVKSIAKSLGIIKDQDDDDDDDD